MSALRIAVFGAGAWGKNHVRNVAAMPEAERIHAYDHAHYIWYFWVGVGVAAFLALMVFKTITDRIDRRKAAEAAKDQAL